MFSTVKVYPKVIVEHESDAERAKDMLERAEKGCLISNSVKSKVELHPEIEIQRDVD
jgi:organic hydroperoxide reductase OsmC/OhrA